MRRQCFAVKGKYLATECTADTETKNENNRSQTFICFVRLPSSVASVISVAKFLVVITKTTKSRQGEPSPPEKNLLETRPGLLGQSA